MREQKESVEGNLVLGALWNSGAKVKIAQTGGKKGKTFFFFPRIANGLWRNSTAVILQIEWQVTATDVPSICGELITH